MCLCRRRRRHRHRHRRSKINFPSDFIKIDGSVLRAVRCECGDGVVFNIQTNFQLCARSVCTPRRVDDVAENETTITSTIAVRATAEPEIS